MCLFIHIKKLHKTMKKIHISFKMLVEFQQEGQIEASTHTHTHL